LPKKKCAIGKAAEIHSIFVDTSAWIALFSRRDQHHGEVDRAFRTIVASKQRLLTTNLVLAEVHRLLLYRAGIHAAVVALEKIEASPLVGIEFVTIHHHKSAKSWLNSLSAHSITYTDAISFAVIEASDCARVLSYDRHFHLAGFELL
jgi:uncharacterized protein